MKISVKIGKKTNAKVRERKRQVERESTHDVFISAKMAAQNGRVMQARSVETQRGRWVVTRV